MSASAHFHSLNIAAVRPETDSAICVTFDVPAPLKDTFRYTQGQFLTLKSQIDGEEVRRSYSICSNAQEQELRVGIKRVRNGVFSNFANDTFKPGVAVDVMPPQGSFYTSLDATQAKTYMCIAAGSGITPILSQISTILAVEPHSRITLIYGNRRSTSVMFKEELSFLKNRYIHRV